MQPPGDGVAQGLARDRATGIADSHQASVGPVQGTVVLQLAHQGGVHQEDEMHMAGLVMSVPELAIAHAQMLLSVPVAGLGSGPTSFVDLEDAVGFPMGSVRDQNLARLGRVRVLPEHQDAHRVRDLRNADGCGEIPLGGAGDRELGAEEWPKGLGPGAHGGLLTADHDDPIGPSNRRYTCVACRGCGS